MTTQAQLLNSAINAINNSKATSAEKLKNLPLVVKPLNKDDLDFLIKDGTLPTDAAVRFMTTYKASYDASKLKIGALAITLAEIQKSYRNNERMIEELAKEIPPGLTLSQYLEQCKIDYADDKISQEDKDLYGETFPSWTNNILFGLTEEAYMKNSGTVKPQTESITVQATVVAVENPSDPAAPVHAEVVSTTTTIPVAPGVELVDFTENEAKEITDVAVAKAAEIKEKKSEKPYVQATRELCAESYAESMVGHNPDDAEANAKAAARAALVGKLGGGFLQTLHEREVENKRWKTGVPGYEHRLKLEEEKKQEEEKKRAEAEADKANAA